MFNGRNTSDKPRKRPHYFMGNDLEPRTVKIHATDRADAERRIAVRAKAAEREEREAARARASGLPLNAATHDAIAQSHRDAIECIRSEWLTRPSRTSRSNGSGGYTGASYVHHALDR